MGKVKRLYRGEKMSRLEVEAGGDIGDLKIGDSVAVNGVCLTVTAITGKVFQAEISEETLSRSTLGQLRPGDAVNLEKALRPIDFMGGHMVLGHVDAVGIVRERVERPGACVVGIEVPRDLVKYIVEKGSICVDGVSLTVNQCKDSVFYVNIIPHTAAVTTLGSKHTGDRVNVETDIIGKYIEKLIEKKGGIDERFLAEHGYL